MPFKVEVGPPQIAIHHAQTVLITDPDGQVEWPSEKGLYFLDTRLISGWMIYANGEPWDLLNGGAGHLQTPPASTSPTAAFLSEDGAVPARSLGFVIGRRLARRHARGPRHHQSRPPAGQLQPRDRHPVRLRRRVRGEAEPHRASRPHHHRVVGRQSAAAHDLSQPGFPPCGADRRATRGPAGRLRQWPAQLRGADRPDRDLALLPALRPDRRQPAFPRAARVRACRAERRIPTGRRRC